MKRPAPRLRTRVTLFFALIALVAGAGLSIVTYVFARSYVINEQTATARQQALVNAQAIGDILRDVPEPRRNTMLEDLFFGRLADIDGHAVLDEPRIGTTPSFTLSDFPTALVEAGRAGQSGTQRFEHNGKPYIGVALRVTAPGVRTTYYQAVSLESAERTLQAVQTALIIGAIATIALATFFGWSTSRRLLRPVTRMADAADEFAAGSLTTRMEPERDPDLDRLVTAFNDMADAVQARIEREARFASDVSHELRSPITALSAAVEVLDARRGELPERTQQALDVVVSQVRRFDDMVIDLLELSRLDAGATEIELDDVDLGQLAERIASRLGFADLPVEVADGVPKRVTTDKVRVERIITNLVENADNHGGGPVRISIEPARDDTDVLIAVEDNGPGVAHSERTRIFERFARGSAARHRVGTGLGLALVAEHAAALGGEAWVEDRPGGGARFVVRIKAVRP